MKWREQNGNSFILRTRMQFYYGEKNVLRALDEAEFWKHQESEHTVVIRQITPDLENEYVKGLKEYEKELNAVYSEIVKYVESVIRSQGIYSNSIKNEINKLLHICIVQSKEFVDFLDEILQDSCAVERSTPAQTVINHIIRESQYFIGIEQLIM